MLSIANSGDFFNSESYVFLFASFEPRIIRLF